MFILVFPETGCGSIAFAGWILCFHSSCISACMTNKELWGRWIDIWPWASAAAVISFCCFLFCCGFFPVLSDSGSITSVLLLEASTSSSAPSWGTIFLTRNSRATPKDSEPITARGPR